MTEIIATKWDHFRRFELTKDGRVFSRPYKVADNRQVPENGLSDIREELVPGHTVRMRDGDYLYFSNSITSVAVNLETGKFL